MSKVDEEPFVVKTIREFKSTSGHLTLEDRKTIVDDAILLLEQVYVHLPLKIAMHGVDPVRRLRILMRRLDESSLGKPDSELDFHKEMLDIFVSLRDGHTGYMLPKPFSSYYAVLPFLVEIYGEGDQNHFLVTQVGFPDWLNVPSKFQQNLAPTFRKGVEIIYWNGVPMQRAVEINANNNIGSNPAARFARGLEAMTIRPMATSSPPDEDWVAIVYRSEDGQELEHRQEWLAVRTEPEDVSSGAKAGRLKYSPKIGIDLTTDLVRRMKQTLFAPPGVRASGRLLAEAESRENMVSQANSLDTVFKQYFRTEKISNDIGYMRIYTIYTEDVDFNFLVEEFRRLILLLPKKGLIIDVRGNGGGWIRFAERLLQFLTPKEITPEPYQFISSPVTLALTRDVSRPDLESWELESWNSSVLEAVNTGSIFSRGFPITSVDEANDLGQIYYGPVVLVTDALCYSATDLFAAGFQDHQIGKILGINGTTGAGGAEVWLYDDVYQFLEGTSYELKGIPSDSNMRLAVRRNVRVGESAGTPIEDLGVKPDFVYNMKRNDLLERNVDLIREASKILAELPAKELEVAISNEAGSLKIVLITLGISRIDIYVDGRPVISEYVSDGNNQLIVEKPAGAIKLIKILGLEGNKIVAARKVLL